MWILLKGKGCGGVSAGGPKGVASRSCSGNLWNPHVTGLGRAAKGSANAATYSLQPKVLPLAPLYWMGVGEEVAGAAKKTWAGSEMLTFTGEKGALTHQLAGCTLSVGAGKQDLCWGWHPCPGSHTALPSSLPPALRVCGGCGCCSWAYLQYLLN